MARKEVDSKAADLMEEPEETTAVATRDESMPVGQFDVSNFGLGNIRLPRLELTHGVGRLADNFAPGDIVLGGEHLLASKGDPLDIVILTIDAYWKEYLTQDMFAAGMTPRTFGTKEEVHSAGGTTEWSGGESPSFSPALDLRILIKKPEDITCGLFGIDIEDNLYSMALYTLDKSAYWEAGEGLPYTLRFALGGNTLAGTFEMSTFLKPKKGGRKVIVPNLKLKAERNSAEFQEAVKAMLA